jgi:hypothetical protein
MLTLEAISIILLERGLCEWDTLNAWGKYGIYSSGASVGVAGRLIRTPFLGDDIV